jgi:folate-binding Fe-S cluster repair protein YgfZ
MTGSPNVSVKYVKTLTTQDASKAKVYYYSGDKFGNFEATAYIQAKGTIHFLTLSARDQDSFQRALSAFNSVVTSYEDLKKPRTTESTRS